MSCFVVGDETGQVKLVVTEPPSKKNSIEEDRKAASKTKFSVFCRAPPGKKQDRGCAVTSLQWSCPFFGATNQCNASREVFRRILPETCTGLVIGRANGLIETCHVSLEGFCGDNDVFERRRRFHMPAPVTLAAPTSTTRLVALSATGQGAVVLWASDDNDTADWDVADVWPSLSNLEFPSVGFTKCRRGRIERSDRALPSPSSCDSTSSAANPPVPLAPVQSEHDTRPSWLVSDFSVPAPVECATLSQSDPTKLAFGGRNNLLKILDVATLSPVFNSRNTGADILDLQDKIDVRSICFLDRISAGSTCCATGHKNGRVYIYDTRYHGKPVLDVQVCPMGRSVASLSASSPLLYTLNHCCAELDGSDRCSQEQGCCFHWESRQGRRKLDSTGERQSLVVSDNHGQVYLYDIRATSSKVPTETLLDATPSKKRRKYDPTAYRHYEQGHVVHATPAGCGAVFQALWVHNLKPGAGSVVDLQWSCGMEKPSRILGVGIDRHAYIWTPTDKKSSEKIYLKNKLSRCLWVPGVQVEVSDATRASDDGTETCSSGTHDDEQELSDMDDSEQDDGTDGDGDYGSSACQEDDSNESENDNSDS